MVISIAACSLKNEDEIKVPDKKIPSIYYADSYYVTSNRTCCYSQDDLYLGRISSEVNSNELPSKDLEVNFKDNQGNSLINQIKVYLSLEDISILKAININNGECQTFEKRDF